MRRFAWTCSLLSALSPIGCFDELPPLPDLDDDVGESSSETTQSESESSESGETGEAEADTSTDETTTDESTDTDTGFEEGYSPCERGHSCPEGSVCNVVADGWFDFEICVPFGCSETEPCLMPHPQFGTNADCVEGACVLSCTTNAECGLGLVCATGQCRYNTFWGPCTGDDDCPADSVCRLDNQGATACLPDCQPLTFDCPFNGDGNIDPAVCMGGQCEIPCLVDINCPNPMHCFGGHCRYPATMP